MENSIKNMYNIGRFSGQIFHIFKIKLCCFVVSMSDQVHGVEVIHSLC